MSKETNAENNLNKENPEGGKSKNEGTEEENKNSTITLTQTELDKKIAEEVIKAKKNTAEVEKNKLYSTIEKQKAENANLKSKLDAIKEAEKIAKEEKAKKEEAARLAALSQEEKVNEMLNKQQQQISNLTEVINLNKIDTEKKMKLKDIELHREKLLHSANGQVIPELVSGESIDELEDSFEVSKKRYEEIQKKITNSQKKSQNPSPNESEPLTPTENPQDKSQQTQNQENIKSLNDLMQMNKADFAKYRDAKLAQLGY